MGRGTFNNLLYLNVSHNELSIIKRKDFVLYGVRVADLSFNNIHLIEEDGFDDVGYLKILDLRHNLLTQIPDNYHNEIEYLDFLSRNVIGIYFDGNPLHCGCSRVRDLKNGNGTQTDNISVLDYDQLMCSAPYSSAGQLVSQVSLEDVLCPLNWTSDAYNCSTYYRMSPDSYIIANCSYNYLPNALVGNINILDFSGSLRMSNVYYLVSHMMRLEHLYGLFLSDNLLYDMQNDTFIGIASLRALYLDRNNFTELTNELEPLAELEEIHMENNSLQHIDKDAFVNNTNLTHIYLHNNNLEVLPEGIFDSLNQLRYLSIQNNPYTCTCGNRWLKFWLKENKNVVENSSNIVCFTGSYSKPLLSLADDDFHCKDDDVTVVNVNKFTSIIAVSSVSLLLLIFSVIAFKFRRTIRVVLYVRFGISILHNETAGKDDDNIYDAFISYSNDDFPLVMNSFVPKLEGITSPYKLCIRDRDFLVGDCIATAIIDTVNVSRRTVILLSRAFLADKWCIMQFKAAHQYALQQQRDHLIVVLLENIPPEDIVNEDIKFYLSSNTYVEWNDPLFWEKLCFALPKENATAREARLRGDAEMDNKGYQPDVLLNEQM
ncbi:protein toll-like [Antedon mediterranea]|uniref:protein toll-like n=1 Tax=Antedon mediterranea TaxID=105859 RepID=UPI003AF6509F